MTARAGAIAAGADYRLSPDTVLGFALAGDGTGWDLSAGIRWRPYLNQNVVLLGGVAALLPGKGFVDIHERDSTLFAAFTDLVLSF